MKNAAVIGDPVGHSLSPALFSQLSRMAGHPDFNYEARRVPAAELPQFFEKSKSEMVGFNVTIPHKENIMALLNKISPSAQAVGAVNVVSFSKGLGEGFNTDVDGFAQCLVENKLDFKGKRALILGAGGAARAVAFALGSIHCKEVIVLNKTLLRAQKLIETVAPHAPQTSFLGVSNVGEIKSRDNFDLIVNSTPMGMEGIPFTNQDFFTEILTTVSGPRTVFFDLIYRPENTIFLKMARAQDSKAIGGLDMLINQALATWEIWMGPLKDKAAVKDGLRDFLKKTMEASKNHRLVFLTGFMGVGKSTVGKILARDLGWGFIDTDHLVEKKAGKTVAEIFAVGGEKEFRELEKKAVEEAGRLTNTVVALGGGALTDNKNLSTVMAQGVLVYLSASIENIVTRLKDTKDIRPLLQQEAGGEITTVVSKMLSTRRPQYEKAHFTVFTDKLEAGQVVEKVMTSLSQGRAQ